MIDDNNRLNSLSDSENTNSSLDKNHEDQQNSQETVIVQGTTFTKEEIEEANKPQPNVIMSTIDHDPVISGTGTRDNDRVNPRANEAPDSTDTNTGGIIAGGAKGANQS